MHPTTVVVAFEAGAIQLIARPIVGKHHGRRIARMLHMLFAGSMTVGALHTIGLMEEAEHRVFFLVTGEALRIGCLNPPGYQHQQHRQQDAGNYPLIFHFSSIHSWTVGILSR